MMDDLIHKTNHYNPRYSHPYHNHHHNHHRYNSHHHNHHNHHRYNSHHHNHHNHHNHNYQLTIFLKLKLISQLPAYNIFEVEINSCLIVDIFIFNVKNLSVDVNINNTKLIFVKFEYDLPKDPEGSNCLLREAVFPDKEVILNLELPKRQVYILN
ncbi:hypothetical protein GLOIN_2v1489214 [Rhizophagus irregularis DAOM 181602=DAOM 197198]|nr:hypothetical protein GLOIN_2v1489214 [Rhizophagus irregularis DAOM 181602=DAOM 197198]